ncbi:MAG: alpha/beta hydrolase [Elusimicrobiaceae bacterium]|nr:alpha/beta hydrolase [Elusimicrobiaceae bacterium]
MRKLFLLTLFCLCFAGVWAQDNIAFGTSDDWNIYGTFYKGESDRCVILLHDLEKSHIEFATLAENLRSENFCYLSIDLRGHGLSTNKGKYEEFEKTGQKNEFNKMIEDVDSAVKYMENQGFTEENIYLLGVGLGANVAGKSLTKHPNIAGIAMVTPSLKQRDVVTLSGIKDYKGPVFIGVSSDDRKQFMEASFIRNASFLHSGAGKVTFQTAYNLKGAAMLNKYMLPSLIQWLKTPTLPEIKPDIITISTTEEEPLAEQNNVTSPDGN